MTLSRVIRDLTLTPQLRSGSVEALYELQSQEITSYTNNNVYLLYHNNQIIAMCLLDSISSSSSLYLVPKGNQRFPQSRMSREVREN